MHLQTIGLRPGTSQPAANVSIANRTLTVCEQDFHYLLNMM